MKIVIILACAVVVAIAAVLAYAATRPDTFRVARSTTVAATPDKIFPLINELRGWGAWSPYEAKDPDMKRSYDGPAAGKGAIYAWDGDKNVGQGRMEIIDATAPSKIVIKLDFIRPFEGHNIATFTMAPDGNATAVTWAMDGPVPFIGKVMHVLINMDKMIGKDFEIGLANLKALAERPALAQR